MNFFKKIGVLAFVLMLLLPVSNAFAYEGGLLEGKLPVNYNYNDGANATDNDTSTSLYYHEPFSYQLDEPTTIDSYYLNATGTWLIYLYANNGTRHTLGTTKTGSTGVVKLDAPIPNVEYIEVFTNSTNGYIYELDVYGTTEDLMPPGEINNLNYETTENSVTFTFDLPGDDDFSHVKVYQNDVLIKENVVDQSLNINNLKEETLYNFKFTTVDLEGNESTGFVQEVTTDYKPVGEVSNLKVEPEYDQVNLSWEVPKHTKFDHVNIYRDEIVETSMIDKFLGVTTVHAEASTEIFETNGTYFKDLTVEPEKEYEYTVTTTDSYGVESTGVTLTTSTPTAPPITFKEIGIPFSVGDLIKSGNGLLALIGGFVLLALSFLLAPKLIKLIRSSFNKKGVDPTARRSQAEDKEKIDKQTEIATQQPTVKIDREQRIKERKQREPREARNNETPTIKGRKGQEVKPPRNRRAGRLGRVPREPRQTKQPKQPRERNREIREPREGRRSG